MYPVNSSKIEGSISILLCDSEWLSDFKITPEFFFCANVNDEVKIDFERCKQHVKLNEIRFVTKADASSLDNGCLDSYVLSGHEARCLIIYDIYC